MLQKADEALYVQNDCRGKDTQNIKGSLDVLPVCLLSQLESIFKYYFGDGTDTF